MFAGIAASARRLIDFHVHLVREVQCLEEALRSPISPSTVD